MLLSHQDLVIFCYFLILRRRSLNKVCSCFMSRNLGLPRGVQPLRLRGLLQGCPNDRDGGEEGEGGGGLRRAGGGKAGQAGHLDRRNKNKKICPFPSYLGTPAFYFQLLRVGDLVANLEETIRTAAPTVDVGQGQAARYWLGFYEVRQIKNSPLIKRIVVSQFLNM